MAWICRVISPMIDTSLNLGGAFTNCRLTRTVRIDDDNDVDLTGLTVSQQDGFLAVKATVRKSGFCYSASGTVGARIKIAVENSRLVVKSEVDDPDVDVDIPWYCYVAGAVIGAVLGALLPGVIYAVVGAVLVPLIMYLATEVIEGTINSVAEHIADALNQIAPAVDIPAVGFDLIFSDAFIDDVQIVGQVRPRDTAVVRCSGTASVPSGAAFDLDTGQVGARDMPSGDLLVTGGPLDRTVRSMCGARWARTGLRDFAALSRAAVYPYTYTAPNPVPLAELANLNPFGVVFGDPFTETKRIYGVRSNEGRWAAVQAVEVTLDRIVFRYITWEKALATVQIVGGFNCPTRTFVTFGEVSKPGSAVFVRSPALGTVRGTPVTTGVSGQADPCVSFRDAVRDGDAGVAGRRFYRRGDTRAAPHRPTHRHVRRRIRVGSASQGPIRRQDSRIRQGPESGVAAQRHRAVRSRRHRGPGRRREGEIRDHRNQRDHHADRQHGDRDAALGDGGRRCGACGFGAAVCALRTALHGPRPCHTGVDGLSEDVGEELRCRRGLSARTGDSVRTCLENGGLRG